MQSSKTASVTIESSNAFSFVSKFSKFAFDSTVSKLNSDGFAQNDNKKVIDEFRGYGRKRGLKVVCGLSSGSSRTGSSVHSFFNEFNKFIRFHCDRLPLGFASVKGNSPSVSGLGEGNNGGGVLEDGNVPLSGFENNGKKKVLILMSDTGGGHRASAEAIKWAFNEKFGDEYEVVLRVVGIANEIIYLIIYE
uniref:Monogalactosyldiacylglycerol synthase, chloroplastic-like n=1 Tax=Tanacetum cinerariifolium TaxID=118510 RepID=A0A699I7U7_TANCI|nr:monogalactosyldiacylglycerol synthase, chloroplastic-like [Tanacetum cinerariifolium]